MNINQLLNGIKGLTKASLNIDKASDNIIKERLIRCKKCDNYSKNNNNIEKCEACGCYLKFKIKILSEKCPLNLWKE